ncbi:DUF4142 domain-containing protein [Chondromyces apiculatus]|nr:DUF4142 domain-containing protein [Chondromyces apiculatus]
MARGLASLVGVAALVIGCGGAEMEAQSAETMPPEPAAMEPAPPPASEPAPAPEAAPAPEPDPPAAAEPAAESAAPPTPLSDEQIAAVSEASNTAEIDLSKLAQTKAKDARVKKFAATMVQHHTDAKKKQTQVQTKAKLIPAESPVTQKMKTDVDAGLSALKAAAPADFDKTYVELQVKLHQDTLDTIDKQLLPSVKNAELKTLLTDMRPVVEGHLTQAKELQAALAGAAPGATAGAKAGPTPVAAPGAAAGPTAVAAPGTPGAIPASAPAAAPAATPAVTSKK